MWQNNYGQKDELQIAFNKIHRRLDVLEKKVEALLWAPPSELPLGKLKERFERNARGLEEVAAISQKTNISSNTGSLEEDL